LRHGFSGRVRSWKWRQIIETLIPLHTGTMARIAGKWREKVKQTIHHVERRRYFWEKLFDSRFSIFAAQNKSKKTENKTANNDTNATNAANVSAVANA